MVDSSKLFPFFAEDSVSLEPFGKSIIIVNNVKTIEAAKFYHKVASMRKGLHYC